MCSPNHPLPRGFQRLALRLGARAPKNGKAGREGADLRQPVGVRAGSGPSTAMQQQVEVVPELPHSNRLVGARLLRIQLARRRGPTPLPRGSGFRWDWGCGLGSTPVPSGSGWSWWVLRGLVLGGGERRQLPGKLPMATSGVSCAGATVPRRLHRPPPLPLPRMQPVKPLHLHPDVVHPLPRGPVHPPPRGPSLSQQLANQHQEKRHVLSAILLVAPSHLA